ncbi:hypothetical protein L6164_026147 [Bauhinia variegata]|uniref:Uncharacterized protein n=1 Tax=Bauhinia variegata TaxID=167791 RepID=A0ACB9LP47_BAUVA|nr:hypothetical protein L6164_026147 [Bauhinia variegata]
MLSLFSGSSALWLCIPHAEDRPGDKKHLIIHGSKLHSEGLETQGHAFTGAASACNTTNTNPPGGRGKSPNLPSNYPDFATSSHQQSQAAKIMNPDGSENPPTRPQIGNMKGNGNGNINLGTSSFTRSQSVADNIAPGSDETRFLSYQNSGYQSIHGVANQVGNLTGNGNGNIHLGDSEAAVQKLEVLFKLIPRESHMGDGTRTQPNSSFTTLRGENNFINTGEQTIEGLANEIGNNDGDNNGNVNWE